MDQILLRPGENADINFIANSWLKSFRNADFVKGVPNKIYYNYHHKLLEELLPRCEVRVACNAERTDQILGWICGEVQGGALVVHFCYVKHPLRRLGIGKKLMESLRADHGDIPVVYTHKTRLFWQPPSEADQKSFRDKVHDWGFVYHPYLAYTGLPDGWGK